MSHQKYQRLLRKVGAQLSESQESVYLLTIFSLPFLYIAIIGSQGLDLGDEGWTLTAYQQLFEHPHSAEYQLLYYNGALIGALWHLLFGSLGIYGFRLLTGLFYSLTALAAYETLKQKINRKCFLIGEIILMLWVHSAAQSYHNSISGLLATLSALMIYQFIKKENYICFMIAGIIIGCNIFTRITNLSMFSFIFILVPYYIYHQKSYKKILRLLLYGTCGVLIGVTFELLLMKSLGHLDVFMNSLTSGLSAAQGNDSTHNLGHLLIVYGDTYKRIVALSSVFFLPIIVTCLPQFVGGGQYFRKYTFIWITSLFSFAYITLLWNLCGDQYDSIFLLYTISYMIMFAYILRHPEEKSIVYLICLSCIVLFFLPFGSDYIANLWINNMFLAFPLAIGLLYKMVSSSNTTIKRVLSWAFILFFIISSTRNLLITSTGCFHDEGSRLAKTEKSIHPLATTFTDGYKCKIMDDLLTNLANYVKPHDYLLCWQSIPMIHYLTHTYPYLNNSWPWTYDSMNMERQFKRSENITVLPVVVCHKSQPPHWFSYYSEWDSEDAVDQSNFNKDKMRLFHTFIKSHNYQTVWENSVFRIMLPQK